MLVHFCLHFCVFQQGNQLQSDLELAQEPRLIHIRTGTDARSFEIADAL